MPYIGNTPALDYISYAVQNFTVTAGTTVYTLDYSVANENDIRLVINNVIQRPGASYAYSATGTTLTLTSATLSTDTMYAVFIGRAVQTVTPPANSITNTMLAPSVITGQTAETSVAGGDQILIYDDSATALRKMTRTNFVSGLGITEADMWRVSTDTTIATAGTDLTSNWERVDTDGFGYIGTGMSQSSGIFTFPSTGVYLIEFNTYYRQTTNDANYVSSSILTTLDNSSYDAAAATLSAARVNDYNTNTLQFIFNVSSTTNRKCKFRMQAQVTTVTAFGETASNATYVSFIRLGDSV